MTSISSRHRPAPFLKFADCAPSWTLQHHNDEIVDESKTYKTQQASRYSSDGLSCPRRGSLLDDSTSDELAASQLHPPDRFTQEVRLLPHYERRKHQVLADLRGKRIFMFLDYDGTLTPIISNPAEAILSERIRKILYGLAHSDQVTVGVVTGRALRSIKGFIQITATEKLKFLYAASHGFHIEAAGQQLHHKVGARFIPALREAALEISEVLGYIPGVALEDNEFAVSVHYRWEINTACVVARWLCFRNVPPEYCAEIENHIDTILARYPTLRKTKGKMVFELRINLSWDKGRAVMWCLQAMQVDMKDPDVRLIYIGDDLTDEDAFTVIRCQDSDKHLGILVSDNDVKTQSVSNSRQTAASFFVKDTDEVANFLEDVFHLTSDKSHE
ncbi:uncharacterized protein LOC129618339 [Condylostylus longicornis]|uniref:uncharacterized protein LOC129618339 n=1 Tax=Condylostylus longicornis TaxID=2530218 RepID=UPI00244E328A|nr:uncharacterized protein LOC129618339 [Condylostylus longicornis]